jgi:hypothetical protein
MCCFPVKKPCEKIPKIVAKFCGYSGWVLLRETEAENRK